MDYYANAQETEKAAIALNNAQIYRPAVYMSCLAVELYLKSRLYLVPHEDGLELSHDIVNLYKALLTRYRPKSNYDKLIARCRKYFNESRYPYNSDTSVYTEEFAKEFIGFIELIKDYIDNDCVSTVEDLKSKYSRNE